MGKVVSTFIKRPARNWNIENRAIREIERRKDKPVKAPLHPTTQESIEEFQRRELTEFTVSVHETTGRPLAQFDLILNWTTWELLWAT